MIYDRTRNSPLLAETEQNLLPVEAVLGIVEVKSIMSRDELVKCFRAASRVRRLLPFKRQFIDARKAGKPAEDGQSRCFFTVFAYETNIAKEGWLGKEWERVESAALAARCSLSCVDRIVVLNRGFINPARRAGKEDYADEATILQDWFLSLTNFLARESARRQPVDWQIYSRPSGAWQRL
jgi:hypothetical protein